MKGDNYVKKKKRGDNTGQGNPPSAEKVKLALLLLELELRLFRDRNEEVRNAFRGN